MHKRNVCVAAAALLAVSVGASADDTTGYYTTHNVKMTETKLADGHRAVVFHYYQVGSSTQADDPFSNTESNCIGRIVLSKEGKLLSGNGYCFAQDASGNGGSWSWKMDEFGTAKCPDVCGTFGWIEGYGSLKGASGGGTWVRTHLFSEGSLGTYKYTGKR
jgi:hypothetical protein